MAGHVHELDALLGGHAEQAFAPMAPVLVTGWASIIFFERGGKLVLCPYRDKRYVPERPDAAPTAEEEVEPTLTGMAHLRDFLARGESYRTSSDRSILASALVVARQERLEPRIARRFADRLIRDAIAPRRGIRIRTDGQLPVLDTSTEALKAFTAENRGSGLTPVESAIRQATTSRTPILI